MIEPEIPVKQLEGLTVSAVDALRKSLDDKEYATAVQAVAEIKPAMGLEATGLDEVRNRSALVDQLILELPTEAVEVAEKLLSVLHSLVPSRNAITKSPGRNPPWVDEHQSWVTGVHQRRSACLRARFPALYLQHMKSCDACGRIQTFRLLINDFEPSQISAEFCSAAIEFCEARIYVEQMQTAGWRNFVSGLSQLAKCQHFPQVYFDHVLTCGKKCGSWKVFKSIVQRPEPLSEMALRSAFKFIQRDDLRSYNKTEKYANKRVKTQKGLQMLIPHCSLIEPPPVRTKLLQHLFRMRERGEVKRTLRKPFLSYHDALHVRKLPEAGDLNQAKFFCDVPTLKKVVRHAQWRVEFMLKLLVAIYEDGRDYKWEAAYLQYGEKKHNLVQCHSAVISSLSYKDEHGHWINCSDGESFHWSEFLHEINHCVALERSFNDIDSAIEGKEGEGKVRDRMNATLNKVSGSVDGIQEPQLPADACVDFVNHLVEAHEELMKDKAWEQSGKLRELEYLRMHVWVYNQLAPLGEDEKRALDPNFLRYCVAKDLGDEYDLRNPCSPEVFLQWRKRLLEE